MDKKVTEKKINKNVQKYKSVVMENVRLRLFMKFFIIKCAQSENIIIVFENQGQLINPIEISILK